MKSNKYVLKNVYLFILLLMGSLQLSAQPLTVRVLNAETKRPLPFVHILFDSEKLGTSSNIDGYFSMDRTDATTIRLAYLGFEPAELAVQDITDGDTLKLNELSAGINKNLLPQKREQAIKIIKKAVKNREKHLPDNLDSYQYQIYNKFTLLLTDKMRERFFDTTVESPDSLQQKIRDILDQNDLFLMETVSTKLYKKPQKEKEIVIANRVSGLEDPSFFLWATQLQSFTFYNDYVSIFGSDFLSPFSQNSWDNYDFQLEQSFLNSSNDSLFVIWVTPKKDKNFKGLEGVLCINSDDYAIESLRVNAAENDEQKMKLSIVQSYDKLATGQWFPKARISEILFSQLDVPGIIFPQDTLNIHALGKTYYSNRQVNIPIDDKVFKGPDLTVKPTANEPNNKALDNLRSVPLTSKDSLIYQINDSLKSHDDLIRKIHFLETAARWRYQIGPVDVLLDHIIGLNRFEGLQLGFGAETNQTFSRKFSLGGYWRYGLKDDQVKYGGDVRFRVDSVSNTHVFAHYENDVKEDGEIQFLEQQKPFISQQLDSWYRQNFTYHKMYKVGIEGRIFPSLIATAYWKNYRLMNPFLVESGLSAESFTYNLVGAQFRLTFKERLFRQQGEIFSFGSNFPVLHLNYERALKRSSDRSYQAIDLKLYDSYKIRNLGETEFILLGSLRNADGVVNLLASPPFSRPRIISIYNEAAFATMYINEFVLDKLFILFWRHNFGSLLYRSKEIHPDILLAFNAGVGSSKYDDQISFSQNYSSISKGYYEAGILADRLARLGLFWVGAGAFYRFGPYQLDSFKDNVAFKVSLSFII